MQNDRGVIPIMKPNTFLSLVWVTLMGCTTAQRDTATHRHSTGSPSPSQGESTARDPGTELDTRAFVRDQSPLRLEEVAQFRDSMPTGVTVSRQGRIFLNFPRWGDPVPFTVGELKNGEVTAFPDLDINKLDEERAAETLVSIQSVVVDPNDRLWVLDTG